MAIKINQYEHGGCRIYSEDDIAKNRKLICDAYTDGEFSEALFRFVEDYYGEREINTLVTNPRLD